MIIAMFFHNILLCDSQELFLFQSLFHIWHRDTESYLESACSQYGSWHCNHHDVRIHGKGCMFCLSQLWWCIVWSPPGIESLKYIVVNDNGNYTTSIWNLEMLLYRFSTIFCLVNLESFSCTNICSTLYTGILEAVGEMLAFDVVHYIVFRFVWESMTKAACSAFLSCDDVLFEVLRGLKA